MPKFQGKTETTGQYEQSRQSVLQRILFPQQRDQPRREQYEQRQVPQISDNPVPRDSKRAVEVNYSQGKSTLRIMVRNDELTRDAWMIKRKVESNKGERLVNQYCKGKPAEPQPVQLTRIQKRRMQRKRSL